MKTKESPNLYEILKATSRAEPPPPDVQPRPVAPAEPPPAASMIPGPPPEPAPEVPLAVRPPLSIPRKGGPGERVLRVTYNTAIFAALAVVGLLFISYAVGIRVGRTRAREQEPSTPLRAAPALPKGETILKRETDRLWAIQLIRWLAEGNRNRIIALENAEILVKALKRDRFPDAWYALEQEGGKNYIILRYGKFKERDTEETRRLLDRLVQYRYRGKKIFAESAGMESLRRE